MNFTLQDILRQFDNGTWVRGQEYARTGKVIDWRRQGDRIEAKAAGSGAATYLQSIRIANSGGNGRIEGHCTCPVSYNCKHVVAALLVVLQAESTPSRSGLTMAAERWLDELDTVQGAAAGAVASSGQQAYRLSFLLVPDEFGQELFLHPCKTRVAKDGRTIGVAVQDDLARLLMQRPAWLQDEDEVVARLVGSLGIGKFKAIKPVGLLGASLLGQLCAQGRLLFAPTTARIQSTPLFPVSMGPQRQAALGWHAVDKRSEEVHLRWRFNEGPHIDFFLGTDPMSYFALDDSQGAVWGIVALPEHLAAITPETLLALVAQAPALRPQDRAAMAGRMMDRGLDRIVPLPQELQTRRRSGIVPVPTVLLDSDPLQLRGNVHWFDFAQMGFDYDGVFIEEPGDPVLRRIVGDTVELIERNEEAERAARDTLVSLGFRAPAPGSPLDAVPWALELPTPADWLAFVRRDLPGLRAAGWDIEIGEDYRYDVVEPQEWVVEVEEGGEGVDAWFSLELGIIVGGQRFALLPLLLQMIRSAPREFDAAAMAARDEDGEILLDIAQEPDEYGEDDPLRVVLPWKRVKPILATLGELYFNEHVGTALRLPALDAARLAELEQAAQLRWLGGERLRALGNKLNAFDGIRQVDVPAGLQATLRAYQHAGLSWMQFLREYGFGGILADDMGLGKTVQTLAHILAEKEAGRLDLPALVIAPTSLMGNWQDEAARFAPGLRVLLLHGKDRQASFDRIADADIVLTTYALLGRDEEALRRHRYHLLILDEAQYIKNHRSRAAQVACLLDARHRLCLTGTPVQNHLGELWSQFHFLMPGLLGDEKTFKRRFRTPIEQQGDGQRRDLLARRLKPFMLRRTKDKVATELPPKTEVALPVDFGAAQRDLYETVRVAMDRRVRDEIDRKGLARSHIVILDALLKLRQICCDPRLLDADSEAGSAKMDALLELLDTLLSEERKVLVFSQFTSMLALIGDALRARGVDFVTLTGDTVDRAAPVAAFQQGRVGVFLISLKAGGVGLNLTAADTVIHYDPWWNPASENQATDRAWRIGQDQPVFVYKLIARGTLEEKIQEMQRRKGALADAVLAPEAGLAQAIGPDDLQAMFSAM